MSDLTWLTSIDRQMDDLRQAILRPASLILSLERYHALVEHAFGDSDCAFIELITAYRGWKIVLTTQPDTAEVVPDACSGAECGESPADLARASWEVTVVADPWLYTNPQHTFRFPWGEPERCLSLGSSDNLIGRCSSRLDIRPDIPLTDPGVSKRHALLRREDDGSIWLMDTGSTNGTALNGVEVQAGIRTPVLDGDQLTLGYWTRLTLRRRDIDGTQPIASRRCLPLPTTVILPRSFAGK